MATLNILKEEIFMEKLQKEIEKVLLNEVYNPMFNFMTKGIESKITCAPLLAEKIMSLVTSLPNYGNEEDNYSFQESDLKIGKAIKFYRNRKGLTQSELAESMGMSLSSIQKYEADDVSISFKVALSLAACLGISTNDLSSFRSDDL